MNILMKCLDVTDGVDADGTKLQLWDCDSQNQNRNQQWSYNLMSYDFEWAGSNKCIDLTDGNIDNGNQLQIWTCNSSPNRNQRWFDYPGRYPPPGKGTTLEAGTPGSHGRILALYALQNQDHASLGLEDITTSGTSTGNGTWTVPPLDTVGSIATYRGTKCLSIRAGGESVEIMTCNGDAIQLWKISGFERARTISWAGGNKCVNQGVSTHLCLLCGSGCSLMTRKHLSEPALGL